MKRLGWAVFFFVGAVSAVSKAGTRGFEIEFNIAMGRGPASKAHVVVKEGERAALTQFNSRGENYFVDVIAKEATMQGRDGIYMDFVVGVVGRYDRRTVISHPKIFTMENQSAQLTVGAGKGAEPMNVTVVAQRKTL